MNQATPPGFHLGGLESGPLWESGRPKFLILIISWKCTKMTSESFNTSKNFLNESLAPNALTRVIGAYLVCLVPAHE